MFLVDVGTWSLLPLYMMVDGFSHAQRVMLAEPSRMGLDVTGHAWAIETAPEAEAEEFAESGPGEENSSSGGDQK